MTRARLLEQLGQVRDTRLAFVVAPAGFGKTTLVAQWLATRKRAALRFNTDELPSESELRSQRLALKEAAALVIDIAPSGEDMHRPALERFIVQGVSYAPVIVCGRRLPSLNLAQDELPVPTVVTAPDLAFRPWEVEELFANTLSDPLGGDEVLDLTERTEGWAAALHLWHVARRLWPHQHNGSTSGAALSTMRFPECLRTYLADRVLRQASDETMTFLRETSVFDVVTAELADGLLNSSDSHRYLDVAAAEVDLLTRLPNGPGYRCHPVLREHLRLLLAEQRGPGDTLTRFVRAGDLLTEQHWVKPAFRAYCRAGDWLRASDVVARQAAHLVVSGPDAATLLPEPVLHRHPWLALVRARGLLADGRTEQAGALAVLARDAMSEPADQAHCQQLVDQARVLRGICPPTRDPWPILASGDGPVDAMSDRQRATWALVLRVLTHLASGRLRDASVLLADASDDASADEHLLTAARFARTAVQALVDQTCPSAALEAAYESLPGWTPPWLRRVGYAVVLAKSGDPRRIEATRRHAVQRRHAGDEWGAALIELAVAIVLARRGEPNDKLLEQLVAQFRKLRASALEAWALAALSVVRADRSGTVDNEPAPSQAAAFARAAQAPGPLALAYTAMARTAPDGSPLVDDLMALAEAEARACGLGGRPWAWVAEASRADSNPSAAGCADSRREPTVAKPPWGDLQVRCLGGFEISVDGIPADLSGVRPVAQTVLRLLALNASVPMHRLVLVEALWAEVRESAGLHNLHVAVSSLRSRFEQLLPGRSRALVARVNQAYVFAPGTYHVTDLQRLDGLLDTARRCRQAGDRLAQIAALRKAVELYAGDVLPADGPAEWVVPVRERARLAVAQAAAQLAVLEVAQGQLAAAVDAATRSVELDPWRDTSWRLLIDAHRRGGDHVKARKVTQEYYAMLKSLGLAPVPIPGSPVDITTVGSTPLPPERPASEGWRRTTTRSSAARS